MRHYAFLWCVLVAVEHHLARKPLTAAALDATKLLVLSQLVALVIVVLAVAFGPGS